MRVKKRWIVLFLAPGVALFLFVYFASILNVVGTSFTGWSIGQKIRFNGLANYIDLFTSGRFLKAMVNNGIWIVLQSTVHVAIGVIFALIVSRGKWYSGICKTVFMLPNILSSAAVGMLFYNIFNPSFGPVNKIIQMLGNKDFNVNWYASADHAFFAVSLTWIPFAAMITILCTAELSAIPADIFEAALIDGAGELQTILSIKLPLMRNAIGTGTILAATSMLQKMDILIMTSNGGPGNQTMNLPLLIYHTMMNDNNYGLANACGVVLIGIGLISIGLINKIYHMNQTV